LYRRAHTLPARSPRQLAIAKKYGDDRGARHEYGDGEYRPDQPLLGANEISMRSVGAEENDMNVRVRNCKVQL
jgi:hypothetical protein